MRNSLWATLHSSKQPCMLAKAHINGFGQAFCCAGWVQRAPDLAPYPAPERQSTFWVRPFVLAAADGSRLRQDFLKCQTPGSRSVMQYVCRLHSSYPKTSSPSTSCVGLFATSHSAIYSACVPRLQGRSVCFCGAGALNPLQSSGSRA